MVLMKRKKAESGFYHVYFRGNNQAMLFDDNEDRFAFLDLLAGSSGKWGVTIIAWCLMGNHVHLVVEDERDTLGYMMQNLLGSYARSYNRRRGRSGHVFEGTYRSEPIEDEAYLLQVVRYVHGNPVEAGLCQRMSQYFWSSYREYVGTARIARTELLLEMLDGVEGFKRFHAGE